MMDSTISRRTALLLFWLLSSARSGAKRLIAATQSRFRWQRVTRDCDGAVIDGVSVLECPEPNRPGVRYRVTETYRAGRRVATTWEEIEAT